jgi:plastocyanin
MTMPNNWVLFATAALAALPARAATATIAGTVTKSAGAAELAVVYVEKGPPLAARSAAVHKEMAQKDTKFQPEFSWVRSGDNVDFVNRDSFYHNVFSPTPGHDFDL